MEKFFAFRYGAAGSQTCRRRVFRRKVGGSRTSGSVTRRLRSGDGSPCYKSALFSLFRGLRAPDSRSRYESGGAQWISSRSRAKARATGSGRRTRRPRLRTATAMAPRTHDDLPAELAGTGAGRRRGREAVGRERDRRLEEVGRRPRPALGAAARARPRLQEGRALERLHRGDEGRRREGEAGSRPRTRSRSCSR